MKARGEWNRKFFFARTEKRVVAPDVWHEITLELRGKELTTFVDGEKALTYTTLCGDVPKTSVARVRYWFRPAGVIPDGAPVRLFGRGTRHEKSPAESSQRERRAQYSKNEADSPIFLREVGTNRAIRTSVGPLGRKKKRDQSFLSLLTK
jgi:hypothetical protein